MRTLRTQLCSIRRPSATSCVPAHLLTRLPGLLTSFVPQIAAKQDNIASKSFVHKVGSYPMTPTPTTTSHSSLAHPSLSLLKNGRVPTTRVLQLFVPHLLLSLICTLTLSPSLPKQPVSCTPSALPPSRHSFLFLILCPFPPFPYVLFSSSTYSFFFGGRLLCSACGAQNGRFRFAVGLNLVGGRAAKLVEREFGS